MVHPPDEAGPTDTHANSRILDSFFMVYRAYGAERALFAEGRDYVCRTGGALEMNRRVGACRTLLEVGLLADAELAEDEVEDIVGGSGSGKGV